jgi:hypothetical protein
MSSSQPRYDGIQEPDEIGLLYTAISSLPVEQEASSDGRTVKSESDCYSQEIIGLKSDWGAILKEMSGRDNVADVDWEYGVIALKSWIDSSGETRPAEDFCSYEVIQINVKDGSRYLSCDVDNPAEHVADLPDGRIAWRDDGGMFYIFDPKTATLREILDLPDVSESQSKTLSTSSKLKI